MTAISLEIVAWSAWFVYWVIAARDTLAHEWRESKLSMLLYRVPLGIAVILLCLGPAWLGYLRIPVMPFGEFYAWTGALITLLGLGFALWARIHLSGNWSASIELKRSHQLVRTGPYRITRHPIYAGLLAAVLGTCVTRGDYRGLFAFILVWVAFFIKSRRKDKLLRNRFGDEYETYRRGLKPWIPLGIGLVVLLIVLNAFWPGAGGVVFDDRSAEPIQAMIDQGTSAIGVPPISWESSLPIKPMSSDIGPIGGTELRDLAAMDGTLYAGNGYWRDAQKSDPALPGPQILALDSPTGEWRVDAQFDELIANGWQKGKQRYEAIGCLDTVQFHTDSQGKPLQSAPSVLLASVWDRLGSLRVFSKNGTDGGWSYTDLVADAPPTSQIRSFGFHRDTVTGIEHVFAGTNPEGIVSGAYDPATGEIQWSRSPEPGVKPWRLKQRVMSFAECNGKLYATVGWQLYEREDGYKPRWKPVFTFGCWGRWVPLNGGGGLRGLTTVADPSGEGQDLLAVAEGSQSCIIRIAPLNGFQAVKELDVRDALSWLWNTQVKADIVAYNDMTAYPDLLDDNQSCTSLLIGGYDAKTPNEADVIGENRKTTGAYILIRDCKGHYTSREIVDPSITPKPALVATRTLILSPFPSDPPGTLYAGGFDAGNIRPHNSAWLYRGAPELPESTAE